MRVTAKICGNQIKLIKRGGWDGLVSFRDAQTFWEQGRITKYNSVFERLVENDFDAVATIASYREQANG